jgi:hypothetical protein
LRYWEENTDNISCIKAYQISPQNHSSGFLQNQFGEKEWALSKQWLKIENRRPSTADAEWAKEGHWPLLISWSGTENEKI